METLAAASGRLRTAELNVAIQEVNDFLPAAAASGRLRAAESDAASDRHFPETDSSDAGDFVCLPRAVARLLTFGADAFREAWNTAVESEDPTYADLILQHIDELVAAGIVQAEDGRTTADFDAACAQAGAALALSACDTPVARRPDAHGPKAIGESRPRGAATRGVSATDDGEGVDQLAGDNDDFEDDVAAAEAALTRSPDPDWPGEPLPSVLDALPRAGSFAHD